MRDLIRCNIDGKDIVFSSIELNKWFINNSSEDGIVEKKIILFENATGIKDGDFVMSDFGLNRLGMKIDPKGWILNNYKKNPVLLWNHDASIPAIGNMKSVRVIDNKLVGKAIFADKEVDEFAWSIGQKVESGILTSGSVGFQTKKIEIKEKKNEDPIIISRSQELFEFSIVNLPANVGAVKNSVENSDDYMERLFVDEKKEESLSIFKEDSQEEKLSIFGEMK